MKSINHIVIITPGFPANERDENCMPYLHVYLKHLMTHGNSYRLSIIALQYPHRKKRYFWYDVDVYGCGGHDKMFPLRLITWFNCVNFFGKIQRQFPVDIIHSFWLNECAYLGNYLSKKYNTKHICTLMGQEVRRPNIYQKLLPLSKMQLVAVSEFQRKIFYEQSGVNVNSVIPWGVSNFAIEGLVDDNYPIDILGVGSLVSIKNFSLFIDLIEILRTEYPTIKAMLIGDGPEKTMLEKKIKTLKLDDTIELKGHLPRAEVLKWMQRSKILLHTSHYESFGFIFSEGLAAGMNIVSFKVGIASPCDEWRVSDSKHEMIEHLKSFLSKDVRRRKQNIKYAVEETVNRYIEIYNFLLN